MGQGASTLAPDHIDPLRNELVCYRRVDRAAVRHHVRLGGFCGHGLCPCNCLRRIECDDQIVRNVHLRLPRVVVRLYPAAEVLVLSASGALGEDLVDLERVGSNVVERSQLVALSQDPLVVGRLEAEEVDLHLAGLAVASFANDRGLVPFSDAILRLQPSTNHSEAHGASAKSRNPLLTDLP